MKSYLISLITLVLLSNPGCKDDKSPEIGAWKLTHEYLDFGPTKSQEVAVSDGRTVSFSEDGAITSNGQLCSMGRQADVASSGTYDKAKKTIFIVPCGPSLGAVRYEVLGSQLKIYFVCNEECYQLYQKI
jgi:hypothetical protein